MKPLIYFDFKECDGNDDSVIITKTRLKEIFNEIYESGYNDGVSNKVNTVNYRDTIKCEDSGLVPRNINKVMIN